MKALIFDEAVVHEVEAMLLNVTDVDIHAKYRVQQTVAKELTGLTFIQRWKLGFQWRVVKEEVFLMKS